MPEKWTGEVVGLMHINKITNSDIAKILGVTPEYVSMILNSKKTSNGIEKRMKDAVAEICRNRKETE